MVSDIAAFGSDEINARVTGGRELPRTEKIVIVLAAAAGLLAVARLLAVELGPTLAWYDARKIWRPLADAFLRGLEPYTQAGDNKSPAWLFLNTLAEKVGYYPVMLAVVGAAQSTVVYLAYRILEPVDQWAGVAAAVVAVYLIAAIGTRVDSEIVTLALILAALLAARRGRSVMGGIALGAAALASQYALLAFPVVLWRFDARRLAATACAVAGGVVASTHAAVGIGWGLDAAVASVKQTWGVSTEYLSGGGEYRTQPSPFQRLPLYVEWLSRSLRSIRLPLVAFLFSAAYVATTDAPRTVKTHLTLAGILALPLLFRPYSSYLLLPLGSAAIVIGWAVTDVREGDE